MEYITAEMIFTGRPIDANEAYCIGLINRVVPPEKLMDTAREMANNICQMGSLAVRMAKEAMLKGINMPLEYGLEFKNTLVGHVTSTDDYLEGVKAFVERRKPVFKAK
jgi:enoyl-CoA hydratase/carnithine racemase